MSTTDTRAAFEATVCEIVPRPLFLLNEDGSYQEIMVRGFWKLWNAAIAHASHIPKEVSGQGCALCGNGIGHDLECKNHPANAATEAAKATGTACTTCKGTGLVDDGEINHYPNGEPYMCGPVKCVKDCPDCTPAARQPAPALPVKTWRERWQEIFKMLPPVYSVDACTFMQNEIEDLRAALAATAAPVLSNISAGLSIPDAKDFDPVGLNPYVVQEADAIPKISLSDDQLDKIARSYFAEEWAQNHLKNAIHDAFITARSQP